MRVWTPSHVPRRGHDHRTHRLQSDANHVQRGEMRLPEVQRKDTMSESSAIAIVLVVVVTVYLWAWRQLP